MVDDQRVAFFVPRLRFGGAQRVTITIANGLAARGYEVDLLLAYHEGGLVDQVDDAVTLIDLHTPNVPVVGVLASVPRLRSYLEAAEPSILFTAMTYANVVSILAGTVADANTIVVPTEHNMFGLGSGPKTEATRMLARYLYRFADHVVAVSEGVADSIVEATEIDRSDVTVLYNPIPVADIRARSQESVDDPWLQSTEFETIVSVGRLEAPKDPFTLLRSFERVNSVRPNTRLILVGGGSMRDELLELTDSLDIDDVVSLPGYASNPYTYMDRASVFVLSSESEGLPTVLIEALACGCPIIATECSSGPREILSDGEYGTLVPVGDVAVLRDAILSTLRGSADPADPEQLIERAQDFSVETIVDQYEEFVLRMTDRRVNE